MDEHAYLGEVISAFCYLIAGTRLAMLAARTHAIPERLLSSLFLVTGLSFLLYDIADIFNLESYWTALSFAARLCYLPAPIILAIFTRRVFRPKQSWSRWMIFAATALIIVGVGGSVLGGDLEGFSITNPFFALEWIGLTMPFAWASAEAFVQYLPAKRRERLGIADPAVSNRLFLWGLFGATNVLASLLILPQYWEFEQTGVFAPSWDILTGVVNLFVVLQIWLIFMPPAFYSRWISRAAANEAPSTSATG